MWKQGTVTYKKGLWQEITGNNGDKRIRNRKVHMLFLNNGEWYRHCTSGSNSNNTIFRGTDVPDDAELTCQTCKTNWDWKPK